MGFDVAAYLTGKGFRGRPASGGRELLYPCFFDCDEQADSRKRKLYINADEGVFSCKVCGSSGGSYTLQRHFGDDPKAGTTDDAFTRRRILDWAADVGAEMLLNREDVMLHLFNERGLDPQTIVERKLGFVGDGWSLTGSLPQEFSREQLLATGLVWKDGPKKGNDYFYRHLLIPVITRGHVVQIRGRVWGESKGGKYLSGPGEVVRAFNMDSLDGAEEVILTEGEIDCIRLHEVLQASTDVRARKIAVVGLPGTNAWPEDLDDYLAIVRRGHEGGIKRIYIGFDSDEPGRLAAEKLRERHGTRARILTLPNVDGRKCDWVEFLLPKQEGRNWGIEHQYAGHGAGDVMRLMSAAAGKRIFSVSEAGAAFREYRARHAGLQTGWDELDAVLHPGLLPGQVVFLLAKTGCLAGDTEVTVNRAGKSYRTTMKQLHKSFNRLGRPTRWEGRIHTTIQREVDGVVRRARVKDVWASGEQETFVVVTESGRTIRATSQHPFRTAKGWQSLEQMAVGDEVYVNVVLEQVGLERIVSIDPFGLEETFDLEVWDDPHCYLANGFVVHNSGKTLLLCNMAYQMRKHRILFISLEMTREEVYHRLERIYLFHNPHATVAELEAALSQIWICDENRIGERDIAALVSEYQVEVGETPELVFVDYLGYYARGAKGNSPYEKVTSASMQLKADAKSARMVIVAPTQVNRMAKDGKPIDLDDARDSVTGDTRVLLADGTYAPIASLVGTNPLLPVVNGRYQYETRRAFKVWAKQERDVLLVRTRSGRCVRATPEHPLLTDDRDWQPISALAIGDRIAIPTNLPVFGTEDEPHAELLGMLIADGGLTTSPVTFVKGESALVDQVERSAKEFGADPVRFLDGVHPAVRLRNGAASITGWLRELGLHGLGSGARYTPGSIFRSTRETIAAYLRGLFSCDGHVTRGTGVYFTSSSERLARDVQHLLTRFGIDASLADELSVTEYGSVTMWRLAIRRRDHIRRYAMEIGMLGQRAEALQRLVDRPDAREPISRRFETYSPALYDELNTARRHAGLGWAAFSHTGNPKRTSLVKGRSFTRERLKWLAAQVDANRLIDLADSPLTFDEIVSIEPAGREAVYDASVVGLHNFIGELLLCNSGAIEETGDFVLAAFRPDNAMNVDGGPINARPTYKLKLSVLKSRHGGVGKVISLQMDALTLAIVPDGGRAARRAEEHNLLAWRGHTWEALRAEETRPKQLRLPQNPMRGGAS